MRFVPVEDRGHSERTEPSPEEVAGMRADLKRAFDLTDEEVDEAMRSAYVCGRAT